MHNLRMMIWWEGIELEEAEGGGGDLKISNILFLKNKLHLERN